MINSIGLLEVKSIPIGMLATDEMLKAADIKALISTPICPGKYMIAVYGNVGAVKVLWRPASSWLILPSFPAI